MSLGRFLTVEEVAELLRTSPSALYTQRLRSEEPGALAAKVGRRLLWRESDLEDYLERTWGQKTTDPPKGRPAGTHEPNSRQKALSPTEEARSEQ